MDEPTEILVTGDGPALLVTAAQAQPMAEALARAVQDPGLLARSKAPPDLLATLPATVGDAELSYGGQLRAGSWLAISTVGGLVWEYRVTLPAPPRIGLVFRAPLAGTGDTWQVTAIQFLRLR